MTSSQREFDQGWSMARSPQASDEENDLATVPQKPEVPNPFDESLVRVVAGVMTSGQPVGIEIDRNPQAKGAYFTHDPYPTIHLSVAQAERMGFNSKEKVWVGGHEAGHHVQYLSDPVAYEKTFKLAKDWAKGDKNLQGVWHRFFNVFLDVHVNALVERRVAPFQKGGSDQDIPAELYRNKLFKNEGLDRGPRCYQLIHALLRRMMVPDEAVNITPEVQAVIDQPVEFMGTKYPSLEVLVQERFSNADIPLERAVFAMQHAIKPIFEKLLAEDLAENPNAFDEDAETGAEGYDPMSNDASDPENFKDVKKYVKDKNKTAAERAKEKSEERIRTKLNAIPELTEGQKTEIVERSFRMSDTVQRVKKMWWRLIQKNTEYQQQERSGFTSGLDLDTTQVVQQLPTLLTNPSQAEIFQRNRYEPQREVIHPREIEIWLVVDASGSMFQEEKFINRAKDVAYSTSESLRLFAAEGLQNSSDFPVKVKLHLVAFGAPALEQPGFEVLIDASMLPDPTKVEALILKQIEVIPNLGGTNDSLPLEHVLGEFLKSKSGSSARLKDRDAVNILVEITDGATQTPEASRQIKDALQQNGMVAKALKIAGTMVGDDQHPENDELRRDPFGRGRMARGRGGQQPQQPEQPPQPPVEINADDIFYKVWGEDGRIINNPGTLVEAFEELLAGVLNQKYGDED